MKNILTEALVNSATNASFIFSYTNSAKLRFYKIFLKAIHIPYKNPPKLMGVFVIISYVSLKIK